MAEPDNRIRWRLHLAVPPDQVFDALNSNEGRASFWAESAVEAAGLIEFRFVNGQVCCSRVTVRERPRVFALEYFAGEARFELSPDGAGGTDLLLVHSGVPNDEWNETQAGWLNVLLPMKAWLVHGVDLRNHDPNRSWDQGYVDQ